MSPEPSPRTTLWPRPRRRRGLLTWIAVAAVAAVLIEVGAVTDGFGVPGLLASHGSSGSSPPGPNPNPYNELVNAVWASVTYSTANRSFPDLQGTNLCSRCPVEPAENASYDPPVAGLWFYFVVKNEGQNWTTMANFTLTTSGADAHLFRLVGVVCCAPTYEEVVTDVGFTPGTSYGFGAYAIASSVPFDGTAGYSLYFNVTSP